MARNSRARTCSSRPSRKGTGSGSSLVTKHSRESGALPWRLTRLGGGDKAVFLNASLRTRSHRTGGRPTAPFANPESEANEGDSGCDERRPDANELGLDSRDPI